MRRTVIVSSLCLLLGVITSVIVAWWCVLWDGSDVPGYHLGRDTAEFQVNRWHGEVERWTGLMTVHAIEAGLPAPSAFDMSPVGRWETVPPPSLVDFDQPPVRGSEIDALAAGWPARCLHYIRECDRPAAIREWAFDERGVLLGINPLTDRSDRWLDVNRLPTAPLWSGMLVNSAAFGALWVLLALVGLPWRGWHRRRRRKRNVCQHCRYDQRSSSSPERCPECGRDPQARRPVFGIPSISALATACVLITGVLVAFTAKFASESPYSLIHYAAYRGDVETLEEELARGVDIEAIGRPRLYYLASYTPLAAAAASGDTATVQVLIDAGADVNARHSGSQLSLLALALRHDDLDIARRLIEAGADVHAVSTLWEGQTVLYRSALDGRVDCLELLVRHGFNVNSADYSLSIAANRGHRDFVKRMLAQGAPVTHAAMRAAVYSCNVQVFQLMLEHGGDPLSREHGDTLLWVASSNGDGLEICRLLVDAGVDVNATAPSGYTALMSAVDDVALVRFLLDQGADLAAVDNQDETALMWAAGGGSAESMLLLVERGADPEDLRRAAQELGSPRQVIIDRVLAELDENP